LLIGDGSLRSDIEQKVVQMGLSDRVTFAGNRSDVPRLMLKAVDVFLFPSLHEGLGLVLIEAQAAGLPCIFSDVVPEEADLVRPLLQRISLSKSASIWAEAVRSAKSDASAISQRDALAVVENTPFNIAASVKKLTEVYEANLSKS
jgi:glycosyltransferase involved in cell wall biosynthesis